MRVIKFYFVACASSLLSLAHGQGWQEAYIKALDHAKAGRWVDARASFQASSALRAEDFAGPTRLNVSPTETTLWRGGSPYSANFGAAYAGYRVALALDDDDKRIQTLGAIVNEFQALINKGQRSPESVFLAATIYANLGNDAALDKLSKSLNALGNAQYNWKVDSAFVLDVDREMIATFRDSNGAANRGPAVAPKQDTARATTPAAASAPAQAGGTPTAEPTKKPAPKENNKAPQGNPTGDQGNPTGDNARPKPKPKPKPENETPVDNGIVQKVDTKFALLIGNSQSKLGNGLAPSFGASDAEYLKTILVDDAGYLDTNVVVVTNATAAGILEAANALATKCPENGTVAIYYTGLGTHLQGKDYLIGVDAALPSDISKMLEKGALFKPFVQRGARIFAFFQVPRPMSEGRYFGMESTQVGAISQMQSTLPGASVFSTRVGEKNVGLFTSAFANVLHDMRSNKVPVLEFSWRVFDKIRRGSTGDLGGGSQQVPTLPIFTNIASDARF